MEEQVTFTAGTISLEGLLSRPDVEAKCGVVVCHPHPLRGGEMHNNVVSALVKDFMRAGMATLRFNFRGVGGSGGLHDEGRGEVDDVKGAVTYLLSRGSFSTVAVAGYSFGSMVGMRAGGEDARVHKIVGVALPIATREASFLRQVGKPKLLISGDQDTYSPKADLQTLFDLMPEPKSLTFITGADHFFRGLEERVAEVATAFLADGLN